MSQRLGLFALLGLLSVMGLFGVLNYPLYEGTHEDIHVKATLIDVDKISGGYRCSVKVEVTNERDHNIKDIDMNLTILTAEGNRYFSKLERLELLEVGGTWTKIYQIAVKEDPGEEITIILQGNCTIQGERIDINEKVLVKVDL